ncbi:MAG: hypothetical protein A2W91_17330 [Bacteroidetes bacterium GWF2_38_335]|nr:MAG: hypothetical protein A2W91_17330 [Bacteroidetes bacterium GWF2_38_335]OFY79555.1 MAG: hypothetical protein A2281_14075 [Bacteroidetes bacterium RIFOXYA12_FULL_38_20]HBS87340.1 DNA-binding response regulator [Bacteroidales bacterium]
MIKAIIIDDEKDARFLLKNLIERHFANSVQIVAEADGIESGIKTIAGYSPDLVFLDIQMRMGTGFDLLKKIGKVDFEVIFVTAYNQYALDAFKFSAFGYLLKPIKTSELRDVICKLEGHLTKLKEGVEKRLKVLIENYGNEGEIRKLIITNVEGFQVEKIDSIIRLEGDRNYTHFIIENKKRITSSKNIGEYEELLNKYGFLRIHQSTIISLRHVTGYTRGDGGSVEMTDGASVKVSRYRKAEFLKRFL